ncbi:di-heme oxidoreductase family protein [Myroides odoratus]|uniref:di-heme oxidoreductase family protein n=1 Tax=Myroides odoratus TaxID=256 RepID=UPI000765C759|nr:di-heme oxidoredictase family protein [Myroides odoratus]
MKYFSLLHVLLISSFFISCSSDDATPYEELPSLLDRQLAGGDTTVFINTSNAYGTPAPNLSAADLALHLTGDLTFESVYVTPPNKVNGGLGPIFNNSSCISCHPKDGRAPFPTNLNARSGFFMRVSLPGSTEHGGPVPVPGFGLQIQNQAVFGVEPEAQFQVTYSTIVEELADGTKITLRKPQYSLVESYIPIPANILLSPRIGSPVFGLGLLEAIPEEDILAQIDANDANQDGIYGKANYVYDVISKQTKLGRFGWKANTASLLEQCAAAFNNDMGITNYVFPYETGYGQTNGDDGLNAGIEVSNALVNAVTFYTQTLAVPASRFHDNQNVRNGARIFEEIDCAKCHVPKQKTGPSPIKALAYQTIYPYTDLLLHDMGEGLADNRPDFLANGREWKTRPLWGIGFQYLVNGHTQFLHDGRAANLTEAILWHGGEAQRAKDKFKQLSTKEREDLLAFLNSL